MKRANFSILSLLLVGTAYALPLHTITVRILPPQPDADLYVINMNKFPGWKNSCMSKAKVIMICKLPTGKYKVGAFASELSFESPNAKIIILDKDTKITIQVQPKPLEKPLEQNALLAFNEIAIKTNANIENCSDLRETPARRCARTTLPINLVKGWIALNNSMTQITAWTGTSTILGRFQVGDKRYSIFLSSNSNEGTFMELARDFQWH